MNGQKCENGKLVHDTAGIDIYDDVVKFLEQEINGISDESTEIIVCPFQEKILKTWKKKADAGGKESIINDIKNFNSSKTTDDRPCSWTNIVGPIQDVQANVIACDKHNLLVLLTDGKQSEDFGGSKALVRLIKNWGEYADKNCAYALYVMLTEEAIDKDVIEAIEQEKNIDLVIAEPGQMELIDLQPAELIKVNIKDDSMANIALTYKQGIKLPDNIKVQVVAEDSVLNVNQVVTVQDRKIAFELKYIKPNSELKTELAEVTRLPLHITLINKEEVQKTAGKIVYLTKEDLQLELINKPEKTLKISIKK
jgi:hypothetical protein